MYLLSNGLQFRLFFSEHFILSIFRKQPMLETIVNELAERLDDSWSLNLLYLSSQWKIPSFIQRDAEDTRSPHVILEKQTGVISSAHPHMLGSLEVSREVIRETQAFMCTFSLTSAFIIEADAHTVSLSLFQCAL